MYGASEGFLFILFIILHNDIINLLKTIKSWKFFNGRQIYNMKNNIGANVIFNNAQILF